MSQLVYEPVGQDLAITPLEEPHGDLTAWLDAQAVAHKLDLTWLLAHSYSGVIWGKRVDGEWRLSHNAAPDVSPPLAVETLLELRAFGDDAELYIWRDERLRARFFREPANLPEDTYYDEAQILWGTKGNALDDVFTLVWDGSQGMRHAVPLLVNEDVFGSDDYRPLRLHVRHYLGRHAATGLAGVWLSRLVTLSAAPQKK